MNQVTIRKATLEDMATLLLFEQGVIATERPFDPTLKKGHTNYYDLEEMMRAPHIELLVAELNNEIIASGYARIENAKPYNQHATHAYLGFMYVDPLHRGKGINQLIIEALKKWVATQNVQELRLDVYVENVSAIKAYEKIGFTKHMLHMRMNVND